MSKIFVVARHEYWVNIRRPGFIIMTALVPVLGAIGLVIATFFGGQATSFLTDQFSLEISSGLVDHSGKIGPGLSDSESEIRLFADEAAGKTALETEEISVLFIIPADYLSTGEVSVISQEGRFSPPVSQSISQMSQSLREVLLPADMPPDVRDRLLDPIDVNFVDLSAEEEDAEEDGSLSFVGDFLVPYFLGIMLVVTIFISSGYLLQGIAEEKQGRVMEVLLSSITAQELLAAKVLGLGALGLTQIGIWFLSAFFLSGGAIGLIGLAIPLLSRPEFFFLSIVYYILGYVIYAVMMGALGALGTTSQESQQLAGIFSFMAAIPMMLTGFIIANPNVLLARILSWFPLTAPTMMLIRLPLGEIPTVDIVASIVILLVTIPGILWLGAKIFRMGLLMYGKRPSIKQVFRILRSS